MIESFTNILTDYKTYSTIYIFVVGIILKILLDLNLGIFIVKKFYWISLRGIFRSKAHKISGIYKQHWDFPDILNSDTKEKNDTIFKKKSDRQSLITIKQLNNYVYGEFHSKTHTYYLFGEMIDRNIIGHWADKKSKLGYFGSFQLYMIDQEKMEGYWIGHSHKNIRDINNHKWYFHSVNDTTKFLVPIQLSIFFKRLKEKILRSRKH